MNKVLQAFSYFLVMHLLLFYGLVLIGVVDNVFRVYSGTGMIIGAGLMFASIICSVLVNGISNLIEVIEVEEVEPNE